VKVSVGRRSRTAAASWEADSGAAVIEGVVVVDEAIVVGRAVVVGVVLVGGVVLLGAALGGDMVVVVGRAVVVGVMLVGGVVVVGEDMLWLIPLHAARATLNTSPITRKARPLRPTDLR
jgi:hypothetical protein